VNDMAATFQEVTADEMDEFLTYLDFTEVDPGHPCLEKVYQSDYKGSIKIRIYTSISNKYARSRGKDAIRVICFDDEHKIGFHKCKRVHRTQNWRKSILQRIDGIYEADPTPEPCPECEGILLPKKGSFGEFMGCSNYGKPSIDFGCNFTKPFSA
tara:strand:+ start:2742 stop:3206 length:465 start_codon:yes stop_codon:yes gene_type:complete